MDPVRPTDPPQASDSDAPALDVPTSEALRAIRAKAESALRGQRELNTELEQRLEATVAELTQTLAQEAASEMSQRLEVELNERREELAAEQRQLQQERDDWEAQRDALLQETSQSTEDANARAAALAQSQAELDERLQSVQQQQEELAERAADIDQQQAQLEELRDSLQQGADQAHQRLVEQHQAELQELSASHANELEQQAERLHAAEADLMSLHAEASAAGEAGAQVEELRGKIASLEAQLAAAHAVIAQAPAQDHSEELTELQRRFELAVSDAQQHRTRVDELEQELAERPSRDQGDSAEVVHLREECDRLREQVAELESRPPVMGDASEEMEELQRRFEMAVEDVRDLKREKQLLEERLAASAPASASAIEDKNDWEAQKRRLLASLEGEAEEVAELPPERVEERATIEGTIQITDEVICGKDAVISELKQQLAAAQVAGDLQLSEAFSDDERFEAERKRLQKLEDQLNDKLRQTELELSVERAAIARQRAEMEQKLIDLEAARPAIPPQAGGRPDGRRQSNWLKKLGLGGDEE